MRRAGLVMLLALIALPRAGAPAAAQAIPEGQSCGGLLCDIGVFGHRTEPAPAAAPAAGADNTKADNTKADRAKVDRTKPDGAAEAPPPRKPKRVAKAGSKPGAEAGARPVAKSAAKTVAKAGEAPAPIPTAAAAPAPRAAPAAQAAQAAPAPQAVPEIFVPMTPYASRPMGGTLAPIAPN